MQLLSLDLSLTSTGWARNTPIRWECGTIKPCTKGVPRLQEVLDAAAPMIREADVVLLEGYAYSSRQSHAHSLGELGGVIRFYLHQTGTPWTVIPPACVKKLATGKGNAKKELVLVEAVKRLGYDGAADDEADSLWILQAGLIHFGLPGAVELPKVHLAALEKIKWPVVPVEEATPA